MTSHLTDEDKIDPKHITLAEENQATIRYLNAVIAIIKKHGIQPIVILNPYYNQTFSYNEQILKKVDCPVIDYSRQFTSSKNAAYWANTSHFNSSGRENFTKLLFKEQLKQLAFN